MKILTLANTYTLSGSSGITDTGATLQAILQDPRTYKSSVVTGAGSLTLSATFADVALAYNGLTIDGSETDDTKGAVMLHGVNSLSFTANANPSVVTLYAGTAYSFPELPNSSFTPANFQQQTTYDNNMSGMGEFIGRSVVRSGATASIQPLSFRAAKADLENIYEMFQAMKTAPVFVEHAGPDGTTFCYYGWTSGDPKASYNGTLDYVDVSFSMQVWGHSVK